MYDLDAIYAKMPKSVTAHCKKAQPAMEYLMTYGWALLLIAIVIALLLEFGVFSGNSYIAGAKPGSCQVSRPYGPGTTLFISLSGICDGELPEFVLRSPGINNYIYVSGSNASSSFLNIQNAITISAWVYLSGNPFHDVVDKEGQYGLKLDYNNFPHPCSPSDNTGLCIEWDTSNDWTGSSQPIPNGGFDKWIFLTVEAQGNRKYWYADGVPIGNTAVSGSLSYAPNSNFTIGAISKGDADEGYGQDEWFNGTISNVQVYNTTLSSTEVQALYLEGIGGIPIDLQNLVGWWPLDGSPTDYSGDNDNGAINGTGFLNTWTKNYNLP